MDNPVEGNLNGQGLRVGLVSSRFNDFIVMHLVGGAETALRQCGVSAADMWRTCRCRARSSFRRLQ